MALLTGIAISAAILAGYAFLGNRLIDRGFLTQRLTAVGLLLLALLMVLAFSNDIRRLFGF